MARLSNIAFIFSDYELLKTLWVTLKPTEKSLRVYIDIPDIIYQIAITNQKYVPNSMKWMFDENKLLG